MRNRRAPVQPIGTGRRAAVRAFFTAAATGYAALTTVQQDAWTSFAGSHPITDALGQTIVLTGQQMFVRVATSAQNVGEFMPTAPPVDLSLPAFAPLIPTAVVATGISIAFTAADPAQTIAFAVSQQLSPARRFWRTFWQPAGSVGFTAADTTPWVLSKALYEAQFGTLVAGNRIFIRATPISADLWNGTPVITSVIVT